MTRSATSSIARLKAPLPQHGVHQRGLAVVDVGDDGEVAEITVFLCGHDSPTCAERGLVSRNCGGRSCRERGILAARGSIRSEEPHVYSGQGQHNHPEEETR